MIDVVVTLQRSRIKRRDALVQSLFEGVVGVGLGVELSALAGRSRPEWQKVGWAILGVMVFCVTLVLTVRSVRRILRPIGLIAGEHALRVERDVPFFSSLAIPRHDVVAVAIDSGPGPSRKVIERFPVRADATSSVEDPPIEWLFSTAGRSSIRALMLPDLADPPNVAILLRRPLEVSPRHNVRTVLFDPAGMFRQRFWTLFMTVSDVEAVEAAFGSWGVVRDIRESDLRSRRIGEDEQQRDRRLSRALSVGFILVLASVVGLAWFAATR